MGLDNGICVKRNEKSMDIYNKLKRFEKDWEKKYGYDFEVIYFRKCWNVRALIFNCLGGGEDNGYTTIEREDIPKIITALKSLNADNWDEDGGSIWEWKEQKPWIKEYIKNLEYLYKLMDKYDLDVYFYDSY